MDQLHSDDSLGDLAAEGDNWGDLVHYMANVNQEEDQPLLPPVASTLGPPAKIYKSDAAEERRADELQLPFALDDTLRMTGIQLTRFMHSHGLSAIQEAFVRRVRELRPRRNRGRERRRMKNLTKILSGQSLTGRGTRRHNKRRKRPCKPCRRLLCDCCRRLFTNGDTLSLIHI